MKKHIIVDEELHRDLFFLRGMWHHKNFTLTIRKIMKFAGYNEAFFEKMEQLQKEGMVE